MLNCPQHPNFDCSLYDGKICKRNEITDFCEFAKVQFGKARKILDDACLDFDPPVDWTPDSDSEEGDF